MKVIRIFLLHFISFADSILVTDLLTDNPGTLMKSVRLRLGHRPG